MEKAAPTEFQHPVPGKGAQSVTVKDCPFCGSKMVFVLWKRNSEGHDFRCEDCKKTFTPSPNCTPSALPRSEGNHLD